MAGYIVIPYLDYPFWLSVYNCTILHSIYQRSHDRNVTVLIHTYQPRRALAPAKTHLPHSGQGRLAGIHSGWLVSTYCRYYRTVIYCYFDETSGYFG